MANTNYLRMLLRYILFLLFLYWANISTAQTISPAGPISLCAGANVVLTAPSGTSYQWQKDGVNIPAATLATYTASTSGSYTVTVNIGGVPTTTAAVVVTVNPIPVADYTFAPNNQCSNVPIQFTDASSPGVTYYWSFNDPNSGSDSNSTLQNPVHRFVGTNGGGTQTFQVKLTVTNSFGCKSTITKTVTTKQPGSQLSGTGLVNYNGQAYFSVCSSVNAPFTFINSTTTAGNTNYFINWGNGTPDFNSATFTTTTQTYAPGDYVLQYIVTGADGCKDTGRYKVFVGNNPGIGLVNPGNTTICSGDSLTFPITGAGSNPNTTVYTITFNDGTAPIIKTHPPPPSVTHAFIKTSCGTNSQNYPNSFQATIVASNPCATSTGPVEPIYVKQKPKAAFTLTPRDTICVNTTINFTNTSLSSNITSGSCSPGKIIWSVTPSAGATISCGSVGNSFGLNDPTLWTTGSNTLCINFTLAGTYTVKLKTGGDPLCGIDSITKVICVNPLPTASFVVDTSIGCAPFIVKTTTTNNTPTCGQNTFRWTATYAATTDCVPAVSGASFVQGTNAASREPVFQFSNPGIYTIGLVMVSPASACSTTIFTRQITVKGKPNVALTIPATICQLATINPVPAVGCYATIDTAYLWSFTGGSPATSTIKNPGLITYNTAGTFPISLKATNACGDTIINRTLLVNPRPDVIIPADTLYCAGATSGTLSFSSSLAGATLSWTNNNTTIGLAASGTGNINSFTLANPTTVVQTATITVTATLSGCTRQASFTITVNPRPAAPVVVTPVNYCVGDSAIPLSATASPGNTVRWYSAATGGVGDTITPVPSTAAVNTTVYYVSQINGFVCESNRAAITVNVKVVPNISSSSFANPLTCASQTGSITLNGLVPSTTYVVRYTKNGGTPVSLNLTSNAAGTVIITALGAGTYSNVFVSLSACPSNVVGPFVLSDPNPPPPPVAAGDTTLCSTGSLLLFATSTSTGTISYNWTGPNSFMSTQQNPIINNVVVAGSGTYFVTNTVNNCTSLPDSVVVVVNATPPRPVLTSNAPICQGDTLKLFAGNFVATVSYAWTGVNGFTSTLANPFIPNTTIAASGAYSLIVTSITGNCASLPGSITALVKPLPTITTTSFNHPTNCGSPTGSITLNGLQSSLSYTVSYQKDNGPAVNIIRTASTGGSIVITGLTSGVYSNISVVLNGCPSNIVGPFTLVDPNPPPAPVAASNSPLCNGDTLRLTATSTVVGALTYVWTGPGGFSSSAQNPVVNTVTTVVAGKYYVAVVLNNCTSLRDSVVVVVNNKPTNPLASANSPVCIGDSIRLSATSTAAGTIFYTWSGPAGFTSTLQNPTIVNANAGNAGIYSVVARFANCFSVSPGTTTVAIKPTPVISSTSFTNPTSCGSFTGSITLLGLLPATSYTLQYRFNGGSVFSVPVVSNAVGAIVLSNLSAGVYSNLSVVFDGCVSLERGPFSLVDLPPLVPSAGNNGPLCVGDTLRLSASVALPGNVIYTWIGPGGYSSNSQNPVIPITTIANAGTYAVNASLNGCSASTSTNVLISPRAIGGLAGPDTTVCMNTNSGTIRLTGFTGNIIRWQSSINNGTNWNNIINNTAALTFNNLSVTTWYRAIVQSGVCPLVFSDTAVVTIVNKVDSANAGTDVKLCNQQVLNLSANNPVIGTGMWSQTFGPTAVITNALAPNTVVTGLQPDRTYRFTWTITGAAGCGSSSDEMEAINRPAITLARAGNDTSICDFTTTRTIQLQANADNTRPYERGAWRILSQPVPGNANFNNPLLPNAIISFSFPGTYVLEWIISNDVTAGCNPTRDTMVMIINAKPVAAFAVAPIQLCRGEAVTVTNTSSNANAYLWKWGNGDSTSFNGGAYVYNTAGTFTITLIAKKLELTSVCVDSTKKTVTVVDKIPAIINVAPGKRCVPYNLQVSAVNATGASLVEWKIFDAAIPPGIFYSTGISASHVYNIAGTDSVRLIVRNTNGCADSTTFRFTVYGIPVTDFSPRSITTCSHDTTIVYTANTPNAGRDTISYLWFINNQLTGNTNPYNYRFQTALNNAAPVDYSVKLLAQNAGGCGDTSLPASVRVQTLPTAGLKVSPSIIQQQPNNTFTFDDTTSTNSFKNYLWVMGDRSQQTRSGKSVTYQYKDTGSYLVKLITTDFANGCTNRDSVQITMLYVPGYIQVPNAICPGCSNGTLRQFLPLGKGLSSYRLRILTSWGKVIFETTALHPDGSPKEAWTGLYNGNTIQQDTYRWEIEGRFTNGTEWKGMVYPGSDKPVKSGFVTIIK